MKKKEIKDTFETLEIKLGRKKRTIQRWCKILDINISYESTEKGVIAVFSGKKLQKLVDYKNGKKG